MSRVGEGIWKAIFIALNVSKYLLVGCAIGFIVSAMILEVDEKLVKWLITVLGCAWGGIGYYYGKNEYRSKTMQCEMRDILVQIRDSLQGERQS